MNGLILLLEAFTMFTFLICFKKFLGKEGIFLWIGLASVLANIQVVKSVDVAGISATVGNVMFASVFLATDLLSECYGKEEAKKGVKIGVASIILYLVCSQFTLVYLPNAIDTSHEAMKTIFTLSPRICIVSLIMYAIANYVDVIIYDKLYKVFKSRKLWLRNNVSSILCNCLENFGFVFLAFSGTYPIKEVLMIAISTCAIEIVIALCDTPFLYLGRKI